MSDVTEHAAALPTPEPAPAPAVPSLEEIVAAVLSHMPAPAVPSLEAIVPAVLAALPPPAPAEHASLLAEAAPMLAQLTALQAKAETEGHTIVSLLETAGRQILGIFR